MLSTLITVNILWRSFALLFCWPQWMVFKGSYTDYSECIYLTLWILYYNHCFSLRGAWYCQLQWTWACLAPQNVTGLAPVLITVNICDVASQICFLFKRFCPLQWTFSPAQRQEMAWDSPVCADCSEFSYPFRFSAACCHLLTTVNLPHFFLTISVFIFTLQCWHIACSPVVAPFTEYSEC